MNRRIYNRIIAFIMCLLLMISSDTLYAFATESFEEGEIEIAEEEIPSDLVPVGTYAEETQAAEDSLSLSADNVGILATGNCGVKTGNVYSDNLTYDLYRDEDGTVTLTISGNGEMGENCYSIWKSLYNELKVGYWNLVLEEGITTIGSYAFCGPSSKDLCTYIFSGPIDIPDTVTSIGIRAFYSLTNLTGELVIPEYVENIETEAFGGCTGFSALPMNIPESVRVIGARAFYNCRFPSYYLPEGITVLGSSINTEAFPFPTCISNNPKNPVTLIVLKDTYAYTWADENRKYGYNVEIGQRKYRIYYNVNGADATVDPKIGIMYEERPLGDLAVPVRPGYTFLGWFSEADAGEEIKSSDICVGEIQAYAHWATNDYNVSFNAQGGKGNLETRSVTYDDAYGALPIVTRANYDFTGWYTEPEGGTLIDEASIVRIPEDHTLYAQWLGVPMTLSFDKLDGVGETPDKTVYFASPYGALPTPTKENCEFLGWFTERNGGTEITAESLVEALEDHTLYAHWKGVEMKVYFEANGGTGFLPSIIVMYGSTYGVLPEVKRDDKDFGGWYTALEGGTEITKDSIVTRTDNHNLFAHWVPKHVKVSFNANGGSSIHPSITVECESPYGELPVPERYGYDFTGWFTSGIGGFEIKSTSIVEDVTSHTLYAHWKPKTGIRVSFDAGAGSVTADDLYVTYNDAYAKGSSLPIATRDSYDFAGWYTQENGGKRIDPDSIVTIEDDHVLYARWRGKPFTVTFETGETAGKRDTKTVYFDDYYGGMPTPVKYGSKFEGWFTEAIDGEKIEPTTKVTLTEDQNLYAHWSNKICLVTYELDGGINSDLNPVTYTLSQNTIKLYDPYKLGYKFAGWYVGPSKLTKERITQISRGMAEDITLYAKWTVNTYKISYVMGISATNPNAKKISYRVCDHNTPVTRYEFKEPSKKGYAFEGWYLDSDFTEPIQYIDGTFEGNIKLYAKWRGAFYYLRYNADEAIAGAVTPTMHQYMNPDSTVSTGDGFIKEGYHVERWYFNDNLTGKYIAAGTNKNNVLTEEDEVVDVYAWWKPNKYYVAFDGNGATGGRMSNKKYTYDSDGIIPGCSFKKTGYLFDSWNSEADGSGTTYKVSQRVRRLTTYKDEVVTLYAQWKPVTYTVAFDAGGAEKGRMNKITVTYDAPSLIPDNSFIRNGFTFKNWRTTKRVGGVFLDYNAGDTVVLNLINKQGGEAVLKAIWGYKISFDPNCSDYTGSMPDVVFDADKYVLLPANEFERDGYTFMGWAASPSATKRQWANKGRVRNLGNMTLYAVWKAK